MIFKRKIKPTHIILCELANIGDCILTLPICGLIKEHYPECKITFLTRKYTASVITGSTYIDNILTYETLNEQSEQHAAEMLKNLNADCFMQFGCTNYKEHDEQAAKLSYLANIPYRFGQWDKKTSYPKKYFNYTQYHRRRGRDKMHNIDVRLMLLPFLGIKKNYSLKELTPYIKLIFPKPSEQYLALLDKTKFNLIIHPGSNGHAREWPEENFIELIKILPTDKFKIFISGAGSEEEIFKKLLNSDLPITNIMNKMNLAEFCGFVSQADGLIASSTGPLHIAAAVGIHALGLFAPRRHIDFRCWQPLGEYAEYLSKPGICVKCDYGQECPCMRYITAEKVKARLMDWLRTIVA